MQKIRLNNFEFTFCDTGKFNRESPDEHQWYAARMPGNNITQLIDVGIETADPNALDNTRQYFKYENKDFVYRTQLPDKESGKKYWFGCHGLDTIADMYINGALIHSSRNSFVRHDLDLTSHMGSGKNELLVIFRAPAEYVSQRNDDFEKASMNVLFDEKWRVYLRKPQFHYGWDNAPHLAPSGFIQTPTLTICNTPVHAAALRFIHEYDCSSKHADFSIGFDGTVYDHCKITFELRYDEKSVWRSPAVTIEPGSDCYHGLTSGELSDVKEWMPTGYGDPNLYELVMYHNDEIIHRTPIGFRHVELKRDVIKTITTDYYIDHPPGVKPQEFDMDGAADSESEDAPCFNGAWTHIPTEPYKVELEDFTLHINGQPIFMEGFDWQPLEYDISLVDDARLTKYLQRMAELGTNTVRVWGGAYIESNAFYDFCDRAGIIVWQDFPFACAIYPDHDEAFRDLIRHETINIYRRLENHPSIGLYCGSNEIDMMLHSTGKNIKENNVIGHEIIPDVLQGLGCQVPYHVSSPSGTDYPRNPFSGENRNWTSGTHIKNDYPLLRNDDSIMISEGGCAAMPSSTLCDAFFPPEIAVNSNNIPELLSDQRYITHSMSTYEHSYEIKPFNIMNAIKQHFAPWSSRDELIYLSNLYQAEALQRYAEIFCSKQDTMHGYCIWKFADTWPCFCFSVIDWHEVPKMSWYNLRRVMGSPAFVTPVTNDDFWSFAVCRRTLVDEALQLQVRILDFSGNELAIKKAEIPPAGRGVQTPPVTWNFGDFNAPVVFECLLSGNDDFEYRRLFFTDIYKNLPMPDATLQLEIDDSTQLIDGKWSTRITVVTDSVVAGVCLSPVGTAASAAHVFSDNSISMLPGESREIELISDLKPDSISIEYFNRFINNK
jgi:beta-mannosidase